MPNLTKKTKIYVAGHKGMVGSAIVRRLRSSGYDNLMLLSRQELDLRDQQAAGRVLAAESPEAMVIAAARVGGILANRNYPWQFLYDNLVIESNLIHAAHETGVEKVIFLGSSCIYPREAPQPIKEEYLLTGPLESTNQWYAVAKIAGLKLCEALRRQYGRSYLSLMPTNLYGPGDNFDTETSHVLPAMIRKFHEAKVNGNTPVTLWGSGKPYREFLHVDDLAEAVEFALEKEMNHDLYNIGTGKDISIKQLAQLIQKVTGHRGAIHWDETKPDGTPRKLLDVTRINSEGWHYHTGLEEGIRATYEWFLEHEEEVREVRVESSGLKGERK